jgi:hypothetical protein
MLALAAVLVPIKTAAHAKAKGVDQEGVVALRAAKCDSIGSVLVGLAQALAGANLSPALSTN